MNEVWAVEYSNTQKSFHIDTIERVIELNQRDMIAGRESTYCIVALCRSQQECHSLTEKWYKDLFDKKEP